MGAAFRARSPIADFMPRLNETVLEDRFSSPNSGHDRGEQRSRRTFSPSKKKQKMARGNHARNPSSRSRYDAVRIVCRHRRSPWGLDRSNLCCEFGQDSNRTRASSKTRSFVPRKCCRHCRTAVELSIAVTECARLARESISAQVVSGLTAHSRRRSGGGERVIPPSVSDVYVVSF